MTRLWRYWRIEVKRLMRLRGNPATIARGIAVGLSLNFIPTIGLGLPVVYYAARLIRGHKLAAMISTMSIKFIFPLLYILNYIMGELLLDGQLCWTWDWQVAVQAGQGFLVGSFVNFVLSFVFAYYFSLWSIEWYRQKKHEAV